MHIFSVISMTTTGVLSTSSHGDIGHAEAQYSRVMREGVYSFVAIFDGGEMLNHWHNNRYGAPKQYELDLDRDGKPKRCNNSTAQLGLPRPRTCPICALGPCPYKAPTSRPEPRRGPNDLDSVE
jgi:hypothetical protein